jgi:RsiW-degrading membrane proteinase PrsW (M82 family)
MELWLAALLFIIVATGAVVLLFYSRKKQKKRWLIVGVCALGAVLLILAAYIVLTFLFLDKISSEAAPLFVNGKGYIPMEVFAHLTSMGIEIYG